MTLAYNISFFVVSYFLWSYIHEMSHITAAKKTVGLRWYSLKIYPHIGFGRFNWASCIYWCKREPTPKEQAIISLAPRISGAIALLLLPASGLLYDGSIASGALSIFLASGAIDVTIGSIGYGENSDLMQAASAMRVSPWKMRLVGLVAVIVSLTSFLLIVLR